MRTDGSERDPMEVEEALEHLIEAEHIKKMPELMKAVIALADKKKAAISSISDLKKAYGKLVEEDGTTSSPKMSDDKKESILPKKAKVKMEAEMEQHPAEMELEDRVKGE